MDTGILNNTILKEFKNVFDKLKNHLCREKPEDELSEDESTNELVQQHFKELLDLIEKYLVKCEKSSLDYVKLLSMKGSLLYEQAKMKLFNERGADALLMLGSTLEIIEEYSEHDYIIFLYLRIVNHFAYLLSKNGKLDEARRMLESILYKEFRPKMAVYSTEELFSMEESDLESSRSKFNKLMLNNIQMLGWIYGKLGFSELHAFMEHSYLQKQLDLDDMNVMQWVSKCCRLVTIYLNSSNWIYARYYLASAGTLINKKSKESRSSEISQAKVELSKAWIHYGLHLFSTSKKKILEKIYDKGETESTNEESEDSTEVLDQHKFKGLTVTIPTVPANFIKETQDARALFVHTQTWLKQIRSFYTLKDYPLQYVNAVLDLSELYRFLAFYEVDLESQYNVQKRRSETLEALSTLLREVRPNCYTTVSVELWRELAEVQIELMGINLKRLYTYEHQQETSDSLKRRIEAVAEVHDKLETIGDNIGPSKKIVRNEVEQNQEVNYSSGESI